MGGGAFRAGAVVETPAGNIDILPTVLSVLGIAIAHRIDGRVLDEALAGGGDEAGEARDLVLSSTNLLQRRTHLSVTEYGGARYLNRAWVQE